MESNLERHDVSLPHYRDRLGRYELERREVVEEMVTSPFIVGSHLNSIRLQSQMALAVDPDANEVRTWRFWSTWMQAAEAVFAMSTADPDTTVERHIDQRTWTLNAIPPGPESDAGNWITAFSLAVSCRDEARVRFLCQIPTTFLKEAGEVRGGGYDDFIYPWIDAIQDYILNRSELGDHLYEAMRLSQPDYTSISSPDSLDYLVFPAINSLLRLAEMDAEKFNDALEQGTRLFHSYYTVDEEREKDLNGVVPMELFGLSCMAYDISQVSSEFNPSLAFPYFPEKILDRSWHGEFSL